MVGHISMEDLLRRQLPCSQTSSSGSSATTIPSTIGSTLFISFVKTMSDKAKYRISQFLSLYRVDPLYSPTSSCTLTFHNISSRSTDQRWYLSLLQFKRVISLLTSLGYSFSRPTSILSESSPSCCLTFDDFHPSSFPAIDYLLSHNIPVTLFVPSLSITQSSSSILNQLIKYSAHPLVRVGSHSHRHYPLTLLNPSDLCSDLSFSRLILSQATGKPVSCLSFPYGRINTAVLDLILQLGFMYAFSSFHSTISSVSNPLCIPRLDIWNSDTEQTLLLKVNGCYNWLSSIQKFTKTFH